MVLIKNALAALMGVAMVAEAATLHQVRPSNTVSRRQGRFGKGKNGQGGQGQGNGQGQGQGQGNGQGQGQGNGQGQGQGNGQVQGDQGNGQGQGDQGNGQGNGQGQGQNQGNNDASETCLAAGALQTGSFSTGQNNGAVADGQVESRTDQANFINECNGKELTNGLQVRGGSCNGIPMGNIPSVDNMVSTVIINPKNGDVIQAETTFNIQVKLQNMQLGAFTNATSTYYSAPQELNGQGQIIGHTHVTVQDTGNSLDPQQPLDPKQFAFFKGINDAGNGQGDLQAVVDGGLPAGNYRVCTMSGASNHQPVLMPVAQRGSQEDCKYFTVSANAAAEQGQNNGQGQGDQGQGDQGQGQGDQGQGQGNGQGQGQEQGNGQGQGQGQGNGQGQGQGNGQDQANGEGQGNGQGNGQGQGQGQEQGNGQGQGQGQGQGNGQGQGQGQEQGNGQGQGQGQGQGNGQGQGQGQGNGQGQGQGQGQGNGQGQGQGQGQGNGQGGGNGQGQGQGGGAAGAIGGIAAPAIQDSGSGDRPFSVNGDTFATKEAAAQRACAIQNNACADGVNRGQIQGSSVPACNAQEQACQQAAAA